MIDSLGEVQGQALSTLPLDATTPARSLDQPRALGSVRPGAEILLELALCALALTLLQRRLEVPAVAIPQVALSIAAAVTLNVPGAVVLSLAPSHRPEGFRGAVSRAILVNFICHRPRHCAGIQG